MSAQASHEVMLSELLQGIAVIDEQQNVAVTGLCLDSRQLAEGDCFLALPGLQGHGWEYRQQALEASAARVLVDPEGLEEAPLADDERIVVVPYLKDRLASVARQFYAPEFDRLSITAVTGTNGKTSVTHYLAQMLGDDAALIGTLGAGTRLDLRKGAHTTPDTLSLYECLARFAREGKSPVCMEASSHALDQGRMQGVPIQTAILTNLSRDHFDYHGSVEAYARAKRSLFLTPGLQHAVLNLDDDFGKDVLEHLPSSVEPLVYSCNSESINEAGIERWLYASDIILHDNGLKFRLESWMGNVDIEAGLMGRFSVCNLLAVAGDLLVRGWSLEEVAEGLCKVVSAPGRMQFMRQSDKPALIVDYAHSPDALEQLLVSARQHCRGDIHIVFGCGGDRDKGKRPLMGEIADRLADHIWLTDDNPRHEDPDAIIAEIKAGISTHQATVIQPRLKAIQQAVNHSKLDDVVILAGKGHETEQIIGDKAEKHSDIDIGWICLQDWR